MGSLKDLLDAKKIEKENAAMDVPGAETPAVVDTVQPTGEKQQLEDAKAALLANNASTPNIDSLLDVPVPAQNSAVANMREAEQISAQEFSHAEQSDGFTEAEADNFKQGLEIIKKSIEDETGNAPMAGQAIKHVLSMLHSNENLKAILLPEDTGAMVRLLRKSAQTAIVIKQTKRTKKSEKAEKLNKDSDDVAKALAELNIDLTL